MRVLPPAIPFINADVIAQEISGKEGAVADIGAGRILLDRIGQLELERQDFALETTLATKLLAKRIKSWNEMGYDVHLVFFWLPNADLAVQRVADRVSGGGHHVPEETIRRRYVAGLRNLFNLYMPLVSHWRVYDNSAPFTQLIAEQQRGGPEEVELPQLWNTIRSTVIS